MAAEEAEYELQQLVSSDEEAPAGTSVNQHHDSTSKKSRLHKSASDRSHRGNKLPSVEISTAEGSSIGSKVSRNTVNVSSSTTGSHGGTSRAVDKPPRPPQPNLSKLQYKKDSMDVRQMEQALLHLLDDFHTGELRAFGKNCSMEQMTAIHEQQEHLARLHFELGAQQELFAPLSEEGLRQDVENVSSLMKSLEQLSISIERLHDLDS